MLDTSFDLQIWSNQKVVAYRSTTDSTVMRVPWLDLYLTDDYDSNGVILTDLVEILVPHTMSPLIGDEFTDEDGNIFTVVEMGEPVWDDSWRLKGANLYSHYCLTESLNLMRQTSTTNALGARISIWVLDKIVLGRLQVRAAGVEVILGGIVSEHSHEAIILAAWSPVPDGRVNYEGINYKVMGVKSREHVAEPTILYLERLA